MCVTTPGPSAWNTSSVPPAGMFQKSRLPPVLSKLDCLSDLQFCARAYVGRIGGPDGPPVGAGAFAGDAAASPAAAIMPLRNPRRSLVIVPSGRTGAPTSFVGPPARRIDTIVLQCGAGMPE